MNEPRAVIEAMEVTVSACTDTGRRRAENQDHFLVADLSVGPSEGGLLLQRGEAQESVSSGHVRLGARGLLALVADGMGGAAGGRIASQLAIAWTYREVTARLSGESAAPVASSADLRAAVEMANAHVHDLGSRTPDYNGMGSTMTAVLVLGASLCIGQVGDSRAYLLRGGTARQLTRDQSLVQHLVEAGTLTPEEAAHSPHGSVLMQALGSAAEVRVEITEVATSPGDVLLLCSDGLFRPVGDHEIAAAAQALPDPAALCQALVDLANERGGPDNVTVVAIRLHDSVGGSAPGVASPLLDSPVPA